MKNAKKIKSAGVIGIIGNLFLLIIKGLIGFATNSQAMIADAFNSAGDIFSSVMTYIGNKIAGKPCDDDHNLGHGKAEYIYSMLISIFMLLMAIVLFRDSFKAIFGNDKYEFSPWLIVVCIITIAVKFSLYISTSKLAKTTNNLLIEANSKDHRNDCFITLSNLLASILAIYKVYWLDGFIGVLISVWMIVTAVKIYIKSYDVLMDKSISEATKEKVYDIIKQHSEIKRIIHFNSTPVGYQYQISFTIYVDGNMSTFESHEIADKLEKEIDDAIDEIYLTVVHVNPINIKKESK